MKGLAVWATITLSFALWIPVPFARKSKTIKVQLYGDLFEAPKDNPESVWRTAFLILPDGSHAEARCLEYVGGLSNSCRIEPFAAEKRVKVPCDLLKSDENKKYVNCYGSESYEAERKGNDIILHTVNGKVTYHIVGPW